MLNILDNISELAKKAEPSTKLFFKRMSPARKRDIDGAVHSLHNDTFAKINCLDCANCCKSLGPHILEKDIDKIAKHLKMKPSLFVTKYLEVDDEDQFIFRDSPCPFLSDDNYCQIYEVRPRACQDYPHTDRKKFYQLFSISVKNSFTCPAVYHILEELKKL